MLDPSTAIRSAYFNTLNNAITVYIGGNPVTVPFYDQVPAGASFPYIYVSGFTCAEDTTKDCFGYIATLILVVAMRYDGNSGGEIDIDSIVNSLVNLIRGGTTRSQPLQFSPSFLNIVTELGGTNSYRVKRENGIVFYRTIKFIHKIQEVL